MSNGYNHNDASRAGEEQDQITAEGKDAGGTEPHENGDGTTSNGKATHTGEVCCKTVHTALERLDTPRFLMSCILDHWISFPLEIILMPCSNVCICIHSLDCLD